jgi:hypothetical protein
MSAPALIYLALVILGLGIVLAKDGEPKTGKHSFWWQLVGTAIPCGLLYWGGFFAGAPV